MCGLVALWDPGVDVDSRSAQAAAMSARIAHRGPDGSGIWVASEGDAPLVVAHRRLAVRGLGREGAQPMRGRVGVLAFNGELFGAEDLKAKLEQRGARFVGRSDTEILAHALDAWGLPETLERIRGQFALIWWSVVERKLYLARDRVGIRPLYYATTRGRLAAASEQKALLLLPWVDRRPSAEGMFRYLAMARTDDVQFLTLLREVSSLPPGHFASWDGARLETERYHRLCADPPRTNDADVRRELQRAVAEQLVSDVPIGATFSGGLDSSAVVLLADRERSARHDATPFHLFAYHDHVAEADERPYQEAIVGALQSPHEVHWVSSSPAALVRDFEMYLDHQEEPFGDVSSYAESCLAAEARKQGVRVLLNGIGGDEVFLGYPSFCGPLAIDLAKGGSVSALVDLLQIWPQLLADGRSRWALLAGAAFHMLPAAARNAISAWRNLHGLGLPAHLGWLGMRSAWKSWHRPDGRGSANSAMLGALESWATPRFLQHSDRMCLAHGVESRVPMLDDGVIRAGFGVPPEQRVSSFGVKQALRRAVHDLLPSLVSDRRWKLGFHAPLRPYVAALDERLRAGRDVLIEELGSGPAWADLDIAARWRFGNLGAYIAWTRGQLSTG